MCPSGRQLAERLPLPRSLFHTITIFTQTHSYILLKNVSILLSHPLPIIWTCILMTTWNSLQACSLCAYLFLNPYKKHFFIYLLFFIDNFTVKVVLLLLALVVVLSVKGGEAMLITNILNKAVNQAADNHLEFLR